MNISQIQGAGPFNGSNFNEAVGIVLKTRRKDLGLRQIDLGLWIDSSQENVSRKELGIHGLTLMEFFLICEALDWTPFQFLEAIEVVTEFAS